MEQISTQTQTVLSVIVRRASWLLGSNSLHPFLDEVICCGWSCLVLVLGWSDLWVRGSWYLWGNKLNVKGQGSLLINHIGEFAWVVYSRLGFCFMLAVSVVMINLSSAVKQFISEEPCPAMLTPMLKYPNSQLSPFTLATTIKAQQLRWTHLSLDKRSIIFKWSLNGKPLFR